MDVDPGLDVDPNMDAELDGGVDLDAQSQDGADADLDAGFVDGTVPGGDAGRRDLGPADPDDGLIYDDDSCECRHTGQRGGLGVLLLLGVLWFGRRR
jgi:MYXO-CTERM domain-containing protein